MHATCERCSRRIRIHNRRVIRCVCGHELSHKRFYGTSKPVYLLDANIFLYSHNVTPWVGSLCRRIFVEQHDGIATTDRVMDELPCLGGYYVIKVFDVKALSEEVDAMRYDELRPLSVADKSLIQCSIEHPEIAGIVTYDADIRGVCPASLIKSDRPFFIGDALAFMKRMGMRK